MTKPGAPGTGLLLIASVVFQFCVSFVDFLLRCRIGTAYTARSSNDLYTMYTCMHRVQIVRRRQALGQYVAERFIMMFTVPAPAGGAPVQTAPGAEKLNHFGRFVAQRLTSTPGPAVALRDPEMRLLPGIFTHTKLMCYIYFDMRLTYLLGGSNMAYHSVSHVALRVAQLQAAEEFYCSLFGMAVAFREARTADGWATLPEGAG